MELRHQHKNERDVAADADRKQDELEVRPQWPGKKPRTGTQPVEARNPDLKRIRTAIGALRGGGTALPGALTREYSQLLGLDLSDVRLHRGGAAGAAAKQLEATAYTHGTDIAVADHLDLDSAFGRHVIAHELVHVAQHKRSGGGIAAHAEIGPSGSAIEQEAERGAAALLRGQAFAVSAHARLPGISRFNENELPPTGAASPVPVPGANPPPVDAPVRANVPTPAAQPTQAQPAQTPPAPAATPAATPAPQPRPGAQPTATPNTPASPQAGTPGVATPSGSGAAPNPTAPANREPRPAVTPRPQPAATPAISLDERVKQELENRADPTLKGNYAKAVAGVDALRIQALQFSFTPNGVWNTLVETFTAKNAFQDHFGQIYSANAYRGGNSWADTAQAWIEGLRGVVHIIGDVASVVSAWAGLAALVTGALALILSETVIGGIALGAIAAIAAEVAMVAGAIKLLTDIIDTILGIVQMIILIIRARNSKDPAQRARFAQLLHKEANDFGANVVSIGVQVAVMAVSAGIGAGISRGANSFLSAFKSEFTRMITPALKPWTLGKAIGNIANMARPAATGTGVRGLTGRNLAGQTVPRTVLNAEVNAGLIGINRQLRVGSRITSARETIPFTAANQMRGARLVLMRRALISNLVINTGGFKIGFGAAQLQSDIKQPRDFNRGGTSSSSPSANGGRLDVPAGAGSDLSKVQMWPSQLEQFENAKGPLAGAVSRTQRQYDMAETQAGPELAAQVRNAFQGANNSAGQVRFGAMAVQTDAQEGQANTQRGLQQTQQAGQQRDQMGQQQNRANTSVQRINNEGAKLQSPPPKEGVLGWLYNQTIGRIGAWIGSAQKWVMNLVGKWAMSLAGFSKEEMDIAGIENDMREDDKKDQNSSQEAQDAALKADQVQQTVFQLQENKTRDEQYAIQGMADAQRFIMALEDADRQLAAAIQNGQAYIGAVTPLIAHELQTEEAEAAIDAAYIAPAVGGVTAFTNSIDSANASDSIRQQGITELNNIKAGFPELDVSQGTTAIGTAVQTYTTAFGTLASSARTQAAAVNTALQAFIGTQDYDGVAANAAALERLASDFHREATRLENQLVAAVQSVVDQYVTHVLNAISQAQQVPDEPPAASSSDQPDQPVGPTDQPAPAAAPPVQRKASGTPTIAVQRKALTNDKAPQQMQQTAAADQPAQVPTDTNNPAPAAAAAPAPAGDNANATAPAAQSEAASAAANGAQVPGAAPNGATSTAPNNGLIGGASNTSDAPATATKAKPANATPKQMANPAGPDKAPIEAEDEAAQSISNAQAGTNAKPGTDNSSAPGPTHQHARDAQPTTTEAEAEPTSKPAPTTAPAAAAPTAAAKPSEKDKEAKQAAATPAGTAPAGGEATGGDAPPPMLSGSTIEDGWDERDQREQSGAAQPAEAEAAAEEAEAPAHEEAHASSGGGGDASPPPAHNESEREESEESEDAPAGDTDVAVQRRSTSAGAVTSSPVEVATQATAGSGGSLPYLSTIQESFGHHDISHIRSHSGSAAQQGAEALGASAFAVGDAVAFASTPDLHTAAHEAAHVVQQRAGLRPSGEMDTGSGDHLERHADAVADAVVAGRSAASILDGLIGGGSSSGASVQRKEGDKPKEAAGKAPTVTSKTPSNPDGAVETRTTIGVGEVVKLTSSVAGTWTATTGTAAGAENAEFEWTAPGKPGSAVIRVKTKDGEATKEFAIVGPSKMKFEVASTMSSGNDHMMGAGMNLAMTVIAAGDAKVSFGNITVREQAGGASNTSGYFAGGAAGKTDLNHYPHGKDADGKPSAPTGTPVGANNQLTREDEAFLGDDEKDPWPRPFSVGSMTWQIPYLYSCGDVTDQPFTIVTQTMAIVDSKVTVTVTKGTASTSRTPKQPVWQPPAKKAEAAKPASTPVLKAEGKAGEPLSGTAKAAGFARGQAVGQAAPATPAPAMEATRQTDASTGRAQVKSTVAVPAMEASDDRTVVGVGEKVYFTATASGTWTATEAGPKGKTEGKGKKFTWTAPATASTVTIQFEQAGGMRQVVTMNVIAPNGLDFWKRNEEQFDVNTQGAGMWTSVRMLPFTVSFARTSWKEIPGPPSNMKGYFSSNTPPSHEPNKHFLGIDNTNGGPSDHAAYWGIKGTPGWTAGSFDWAIPNRYKVDGESGDGYEFVTTTQSMSVAANGTTTVTKAGPNSSAPATVTRAVTAGKTPPPKPRKPQTAGRGLEAAGTAVGYGGWDFIADSVDQILPGVGTASRQIIESSKYKQLLADVAASIGGSPKHIERKLKEMFANLSIEQLVQMAQVAATLVAAEVSVAILMAVPEPTLITKVVAIVLQSLLMLFMMHAAFSATAELAEAGWAWWRAIKVANGDPTKVDVASDAFANLVLKMILAILAVGGVVRGAMRGIEVPRGQARDTRGSASKEAESPRKGSADLPLSGTVESPVELLGQPHKLKLSVGADGKGRLYLCTTCAELLPELNRAVANVPSKGPLKSAHVRLARLRDRVEQLHRDVLDKKITHVASLQKLNEIGNNLNILSRKFPSLKQDCPLCAFTPGSAGLDYDLMAEAVGYTRTPLRSHGQPVYRNGNEYISRDADTHNGGVWKKATGSPRNLRNRETRDGTYNEDLKIRIGD